MEGLTYRWVDLVGFFVISFIAWATGSKDPINKKTIVASVLVAWLIGGLTFWLP